MNEYDDHVVRQAFAQFRADVLGDGSSQDSERVHAIARYRRRMHTVVGAVAAAVLLAVPAAGYAMVGHHGGTGQLPANPNPSISTGPSTPGTTPAPSGSTTSGGTAPDGRITLEELTHSTLNLPAWPATALSKCPSGAVTFKGSPTEIDVGEPNSRYLDIRKIAYVDVDGDGAQETVAMVGCYLQGGDRQAVVFDRNASGEIITLGQAVASGREEAVESLFDVRAAENGTDVEVQVGDRIVCCGTPLTEVQLQWRGYRFDGEAFHQVTGPTQFPPRPVANDLAVTSTALRFGAPVDGVRHGQVTITVTNKGPGTSLGYEVDVTAVPPMPVEVGMSGPPGSEYQHRDDSHGTRLVWHGTDLAAGASRTYTVQFTLSTEDDPVVWPSELPSPGTVPSVLGVSVTEDRQPLTTGMDPTINDNSAAIDVTHEG